MYAGFDLVDRSRSALGHGMLLLLYLFLPLVITPAMFGSSGLGWLGGVRGP